MALTKDTVLDKIEIFRNGLVLVRMSIEIYDDGILAGSRYIRNTYTPNMPLAEIPNLKVRALCNFLWTPEVIAAYNLSIQPEQR